MKLQGMLSLFGDSQTDAKVSLEGVRMPPRRSRPAARPGSKPAIPRRGDCRLFRGVRLEPKSVDAWSVRGMA